MKRLYYVLLALVLVAGFGFPFSPALAAQLTNASDTLSTAAQNTVANHTIVFTTPTGVTNGQTIALTFGANFNMGSVAVGDVDVSGSTFGPLTLAANCAGTDNASVVVVGQVMTITLCSGDGASFAGSETVTILIGTNATGGTNRITNPVTAETSTINIAGTMADSASIAVVTVADDSVAVTATVDPTITFAINDVEIGFGDLSATTGRWATANAAGVNATEALPDVAHTLAISTNADNGWAITYYGPTLTSTAGPTISAATIVGDSDGTPGSEQFGISASTNGDSTIATGYQRDATADFKFVASTVTTLASEIVPTATETISVSYLANIAGNTEAGSYSTAITYIATAIF